MRIKKNPRPCGIAGKGAKKMEIKQNILIRVDNNDIKGGTFTIPDGVTSIGDEAFFFCKGLESITIPNGVTSIGYGAFSFCSGLETITVDKNSQNYTDTDGVLFNKDCTELICFPAGRKGTYEIPDSVKSIGNWAFDRCSGLTSITIPDSVTSIGNYAFAYCALTSKQANYKAFHIKGNKLLCRGKTYSEGERNSVQGNLKLFENGIHYCTNLFEIFNYYHGELDTDIAIYKIEVGKKVIKDQYSSKCCTNSCILKKRLYRTDIIKILNGED